jgi:hypothetical protein
MRTLLSFFLFGVGCDAEQNGYGIPAGGKSLVDTDGDGITDDVETAWGTSPTRVDTDDDGYSDGDELTVHDTNPLYPYSHPYSGDYNVGYCSLGTAPATGPTGSPEWSAMFDTFQEGDVPHNFALLDQHGQEVDLYSFCGRTVKIEFGSTT